MKPVVRNVIRFAAVVAVVGWLLLLRPTGLGGPATHVIVSGAVADDAREALAAATGVQVHVYEELLAGHPTAYHWPELDAPLKLKPVERHTFTSGAEYRSYVPA